MSSKKSKALVLLCVLNELNEGSAHKRVMKKDKDVWEQTVPHNPAYPFDV